jgi:hypothetical protein
MNQKFDQLKLIRDTACDNAKEAGKAMTERTNKSSDPLTLDIGDFVYMLTWQKVSAEIFWTFHCE